MTTLENDQLSVVVSPRGAELQSLLHKPTSIEHLWQADPNVWPWHAPNLFPVVGGCLNNEVLIDGKPYPMARHGFARQSDFEVIESADNYAIFSLQANDETRTHFPYLFDFQLRYVLEGARVAVTYRVVNEDKQPIFFSVGAHPAFAVPFQDGEVYTDYFIEFEHDEPVVTHQLSAAGLFNGETRPVATEGSRLRLTEHLFDQDALVFKNLKSRRVTLRSERNPSAVTVNYADFPYLGLWAKPGAPFVCIEPWLGCADSEGDARPIEQKEAIQQVAIGDTFEAQFTITIA